MRIDCIERRFASFFAQYSLVVVKHPTPFIIIPIVATILLATGFRHHERSFMKDDLELYTPTNAQARFELKELDSLFRIDDDDPFYATRRYDNKRAGYIIVTGDQEDSDILNPLVMQASMQLWSLVQSLTIEEANSLKRFSYPSICVKFPMPDEFGSAISHFINPNVTSPETICVSNPLVEAFKYFLLSDQLFANRTFEDFSLDKIGDSISLDAIGMTHLLGGIDYDKQKRIAGAKAILLPYALRHSTPEEDSLAQKWELKLADFLEDYNSSVIKTSWWTYETLSSESARDKDQLIAMLAPCFFVVTAYTVLSCCMMSWVRSRPWLALGGVISAAMAIVSGVGMLLLCGYSMTSVAYSMPFIVFSVGVDNIFILLSAWRATNYDHTLEQRISETFSEAAVSITVTSLTDFISFSVGCLTPFPSVQMFCVYAVAAVLFTYIYQMTFFAGIMVLTCKREMDRRNCLTFLKISKTTKQIKQQKGVKAKELEANSTNPRFVDYNGNSYDITTSSNSTSLTESASFAKAFRKNHPLSRFFRTTYCDILLHPLMKTVVLILFVCYLGIAMYGCLNIKMGLEPTDLLPEHSHGRRTLRMTEKYFGDYGSFLHVWMFNLSHVDLGHRKLWNVLEKEVELYEHTDFTGKSDSWVHHFLDFVKKSGLLITEDNFVYLLKNVFLSQPTFAKYMKDVKFDPSGQYLDASRVPVHLRYVGTGNQSKAMYLFRSLSQTSEFPSGVYADFFQFAEQYNAVLPGTLSSIAMAGVSVIFVSLIFIPVPIASLWVCFCIISINVGILGFMTFWSVSLDFISMVTIVMSIGFCVDFAAHLAYNFAKGTNLTAKNRVRNALYAVGTPILQSASSTILGISFMVFRNEGGSIVMTESYIFRSFFKTIVLVIVLGAIHGLVVLPVLFTVFHCETIKTNESVSDETLSTATRDDICSPNANYNDQTTHRIPRIPFPEKYPPFYISQHVPNNNMNDLNHYHTTSYPLSPPSAPHFFYKDPTPYPTTNRLSFYQVPDTSLYRSNANINQIDYEDDDEENNNIYMNPTMGNN